MSGAVCCVHRLYATVSPEGITRRCTSVPDSCRVSFIFEALTSWAGDGKTKRVDDRIGELGGVMKPNFLPFQLAAIAVPVIGYVSLMVSTGQYDNYGPHLFMTAGIIGFYLSAEFCFRSVGGLTLLAAEEEGFDEDEDSGTLPNSYRMIFLYYLIGIPSILLSIYFCVLGWSQLAYGNEILLVREGRDWAENNGIFLFVIEQFLKGVLFDVLEMFEVEISPFVHNSKDFWFTSFLILLHILSSLLYLPLLAAIIVPIVKRAGLERLAQGR